MSQEIHIHIQPKDKGFPQLYENSLCNSCSINRERSSEWKTKTDWRGRSI